MEVEILADLTYCTFGHQVSMSITALVIIADQIQSVDVDKIAGTISSGKRHIDFGLLRSFNGAGPLSKLAGFISRIRHWVVNGGNSANSG